MRLYKLLILCKIKWHPDCFNQHGKQANHREGTMSKYRLTCPECNAIVITADPEAVIWERCPGCRMHVWERYDVLMAERVGYRPQPETKPIMC